jgi:hypothetical protein
MKRYTPAGTERTTSIMTSARATSLALAALALTCGGCSKKPAEPAHTAQLAAPSETTEADAGVVIHGINKLVNLDVPVFVDGKQVSVLRYGELPGDLLTHASGADESGPRVYRLAEYLHAVGVSLDRVKSVQMMGNGFHVASVEGSELRAQPSRFAFHFLGTTTGIANLDWETTGLKYGHRINEIRTISVFVEKAAPAIDASKHCVLDEDKACDPVAPYSKGELAKGTRIYVDGKMAGYVKRRLVTDSILVGKTEAGDPRYSLPAFISSLGVDASKAKAIDLVIGDSVIARADAPTWSAGRESISFTLAKHSHGKVIALVPSGLQATGEGAKDRDAQITAVQVYRSVNPPSRPLVAIDDVSEPAVLGDGQQAALGSANERDRANE